MKTNLTLQALVAKITASNKAYAAGMPFITDTEYDLYWQQLYAYNPKHPLLYHTAQNLNLASNLTPHHHQIFGTNKAFKADDLRPFLTRFGSAELVLEPKYDGCAALLSKSPDGLKLTLEGDGIAGQDITRHLACLSIDFEPHHTQTVEIVIPNAKWKTSYGKNPRNVVAGWLNRKTFPYTNVAHIVSHNYGGLSIPYAFTGNLDILSEHLLKAYKAWSDLFPIDGIMIKPRDEKRRIVSGNNGTTYAWSIAWKPPIQIKETTVIDIEWNVSRQGKIIPTVIYSPIELCRTINSRATANNAKWLVDKGIKIGSIIEVGKAGEIIPKILGVKEPVGPDQDQGKGFDNAMKGVDVPFNAVTENLYSTLPEPTTPALNRPLRACPICNGPTKWEGLNLICDSSDCVGQLIKQVSYFYSKSGFDLHSIAEAMLTELILEPQTFKILVKNPWALLDPEAFKITNYLYDIWGQKRTENYLIGLAKINGKKNKAHFIAAMGYPGLAYKTTLKLFYFILEGIINSNIPKKAQKTFVEAFIKLKEVESLLTNFTFAELPKSPKLIYCITGALSTPRVDLIDYLTKYRWEWSNQVSKYVDYLVIGSDPGNTKITKAKELGTPTLTEAEFMAKIKSK
jgi:DNA ligase (NAD+)